MGMLRWLIEHVMAIILIVAVVAAVAFRQELATELGMSDRLAAFEKRYWPAGGGPVVQVRAIQPTPAPILFGPSSSQPAPVAQPQVRPAQAPVAAAGMAGMYGMGGMSGITAPRPAPAAAANLRDGWMQARQAYATGDLNRAAQAYQALAAQYPAEADIMGELGNVYMIQGRNAEAADAFYEAGMRLLKGQNPMRAQAVLPALNRIDMQKADALRNQIYQAMKDGR